VRLRSTCTAGRADACLSGGSLQNATDHIAICTTHYVVQMCAHLYHAFLQLPFSGGYCFVLTEFILPPPHPSSRVGPQQCQATNRSANSELRPGTGKGAIAGAGPPRRATGPLAGSARESPPQPSAPPTQPPTPRPPPTTEDRCPVVSNRALHCVMQQRCHHASTSPGSPS
jgi:hypothetical protein